MMPRTLRRRLRRRSLLSSIYCSSLKPFSEVQCGWSASWVVGIQCNQKWSSGILPGGGRSAQIAHNSWQGPFLGPVVQQRLLLFHVTSGTRNNIDLLIIFSCCFFFPFFRHSVVAIYVKFNEVIDHLFKNTWIVQSSESPSFWTAIL